MPRSREQLVELYRRRIRLQKLCGLTGVLALLALIAIGAIRGGGSRLTGAAFVGAIALIALVPAAVIGNFIFYRCPSCNAYLGFNEGRRVFDVEVGTCTRCQTDLR